MTREAILEKIQRVMREVFERPALAIEPHTAATDVPEWDSLTHMNLIAELEKDFGISVTFDDVKNLQDVSDLVALFYRKTT